MAIIGTDYDGNAQYSFTANGPNVVLKANTVYNYNGLDAAFLMNSSYDHFLVAGLIYSSGSAIESSVFSASIDIAATGTVIANNGAAIRFVTNGGYATVNNFGTIAGSGGGIDGQDAIGPINVNNSGIIQSSEYNAAIGTGGGADRINSTGTVVGNIWTGANGDVIDTHLGTVTGLIDGGAGDDLYIIAAGQTVQEGFYFYPGGDDGATDTVRSYGDYTLGLNLENLDLLGDATIGRGNEGDNAINGNDNGNRLFGGGGIDNITAGSGDDVLRGGAGVDILSSQEGADAFYGGYGDDVIEVGLDKVRIDGGDGIDAAAFLFNDTALVVDLSLATGRVKGGAAGGDTLVSIEGVWGGEFDDKLTGDAGANNFLGYLGDDTIAGAAGDDLIEGYTGADKLDGGDGIDTLSYNFSFTGVTVSLLANTATGGDAQGDTIVNFENLRGGAGADTLTGSALSNVINGFFGDDIVDGGAGKDTIVGGAGNDSLTGGAAADLFVFADPLGYYGAASIATFGADTIKDFQDGADRVSFVGNADVHSLADLTISQSGTSTVVLVTGTTDQITLLNFGAANFNSADCIFG